MYYYNSFRQKLNTYLHTVCHDTCVLCAVVNDPSSCLSCPEGEVLLEDPPAACSQMLPMPKQGMFNNVNY